MGGSSSACLASMSWTRPSISSGAERRRSLSVLSQAIRSALSAQMLLSRTSSNGSVAGWNELRGEYGWSRRAPPCSERSSKLWPLTRRLGLTASKVASLHCISRCDESNKRVREACECTHAFHMCFERVLVVRLANEPLYRRVQRVVKAGRDTLPVLKRVHGNPGKFRARVHVRSGKSALFVVVVNTRDESILAATCSTHRDCVRLAQRRHCCCGCCRREWT